MPQSDMNSRRLIAFPKAQDGASYATAQYLEAGKDPANVRFGSKADICSAKSHVRCTPNSDRRSGHSSLKVLARYSRAQDLSSGLNSRLDLDAVVGFRINLLKSVHQ